MPQRLRLEIVRRHLGPAAGWFVKDQLAGQIPFHLGWRLDQAKVKDGRVQLQLVNGDGATQTLETEHVIAATGYKVDLHRLAFLSPAVRSGIRSVEDTPILSSTFESSIPGLYFVGAASANSLGPVARFAFGAGFTARRLFKRFANSSARKFVRGVSVAGIEI
jgi:thioredoxin reductase